VAATIPDGSVGRAGRRTAPWWAAADRRHADRGGASGHIGAPTGRCHPLVAGIDGRRERVVEIDGGSIWKAFGLKPHLVDTFKISNDPHFIDKVRDVVGLYLDPPEKALVLCVDEKSQIQALDRSAPVLPMMPGLPERRTHDYLRHGITTLFAALDLATGEVYGSIHRRHRATEFKKFLAKLDHQIPTDLDVHLICDNYATHKAPTVAKWLGAHPRFHMHHTPTYASWLNQVERWFALLTDKKLRRGAHRSIQALEKDIRDWITDWNDNPKPFTWTKTADEILERLDSYLQRIPGAGHTSARTPHSLDNHLPVAFLATRV
jgi:transposase